MTDLLTNNSLLHGFKPNIRTLWLSGSNIRVRRQWTAGFGFYPDDGHQPSKSIGAIIEGTATLNKDSVAIIGTDGETKELTLRVWGYDSVDALRKSRERTLAESDGDSVGHIIGAGQSNDGHRLKKYLSNVYQRFDTQPPTFSIGFIRGDREIGWKDEWYVECHLPQSVMSSLIEDIRAGRCTQLGISATLAPTLTDNEYAPPSVRVTFGILAEQDGSGSASGWVTLLDWRITTTVEDAPADAEATAPIIKDAPELTGVTAADAISSIVALARVVRVGFLLMLALLVLLAIIR